MSVDIEVSLYAPITFEVETDPDKDFTGQKIGSAILHTLQNGFDTNRISIDPDKFDVEDIDEIVNSLVEMKVDGEVVPQEEYESKLHDRFAYVEKLKYETTVEITCRLPVILDTWINPEDDNTLLECIGDCLDDYTLCCDYQPKIEDIYKIEVQDKELPITPETLAIKSLDCDNCWDFAGTDYIEHDGKVYCQDCFNKFPCEECDGEFKLSNMIKCEDEHYCKQCDAKLKEDEEEESETEAV